MFAKLIVSPPIVLFACAVTSFAVWIGCQSQETSERRETPTIPVAHSTQSPPPEAVLGLVHVGMPRELLDRQLKVLGEPEEAVIEVSNEMPLLRVVYRVQVTHPVPHLMRGVLPHEFVAGEYQLILTYQGEHQGQPLIRAELQLAEFGVAM